MLIGFGVGLSWAGCVWTETWSARQVQPAEICRRQRAGSCKDSANDGNVAGTEGALSDQCLEDVCSSAAIAPGQSLGAETAVTRASSSHPHVRSALAEEIAIDAPGRFSLFLRTLCLARCAIGVGYGSAIAPAPRLVPRPRDT